MVNRLSVYIRFVVGLCIKALMQGCTVAYVGSNGKMVATQPLVAVKKISQPPR